MNADIRRIAEGIFANDADEFHLAQEALGKGIWKDVCAALAGMGYFTADDSTPETEPDPEPPTDYYEAAVDAELAHDWAMAAEVKQ